MKDIPIKCPYEDCGHIFSHKVPEGQYSSRIKCDRCNKPIVLDVSDNQIEIDQDIDLKKLKTVKPMRDLPGFLGS